MSFFVSRAVSRRAPDAAGTSQDRADVFARGEAAVLVVADGAGGVGDGGAAADLVLERVKDAVLDPSFDLLAPARWTQLLVEIEPTVKKVGESTVVVVVLVPGMTVCASSGDSEAWIVGPNGIEKLTKNTPRLGSGRVAPHVSARGNWEGRLIVASDGLFRHAAHDAIANIVRAEKFGRVGDVLVELAGTADDVAVLVAEA